MNVMDIPLKQEGALPFRMHLRGEKLLVYMWFDADQSQPWIISAYTWNEAGDLCVPSPPITRAEETMIKAEARVIAEEREWIALGADLG